jgi:hypothetical protein
VDMRRHRHRRHALLGGAASGDPSRHVAVVAGGVALCVAVVVGALWSVLAGRCTGPMGCSLGLACLVQW